MREGLTEQQALLVQLREQLYEMDEEWRNKRKTIIDKIMTLERQRLQGLQDLSVYWLKRNYKDMMDDLEGDVKSLRYTHDLLDVWGADLTHEEIINLRICYEYLRMAYVNFMYDNKMADLEVQTEDCNNRLADARED